MRVFAAATDRSPSRCCRIRLPVTLSASPHSNVKRKFSPALNHPNIAHVHGLERSDGTVALAMELVEGPTLADRIARGPIPIEEALPIAKQIAEALEAAHEQGINPNSVIDNT